jgi:uncharacterized protein with PCYCGC motif
MGRKSSAKQQRGAPPPTDGTPGDAARSPRGVLIAAMVLLVAVIGLIAYTRWPQPADVAAKSAPQPAPSQPSPADPPAWAKFGPHPQANLPPLPFSPSPPARPAEVVRAAYTFAAEHPEVLSYVPCYCGCEHSGHRGNEDCFVTARDAAGDVTEWEPHGMT